MVYSARRFILSLALCYFVLGEYRANISAFRTFVRFALVCFCLSLLPLRVWEGLRLVVERLPVLYHSADYISFPLGSLGPLWNL